LLDAFFEGEKIPIHRDKLTKKQFLVKQ
jgi:hypothetical protein